MTTQSTQMPPNSSPVGSTTPAPGGMNLPGEQVGGLLESPKVPGEPAPNLPGEPSPSVLGEPLTGSRPVGALEDSGVRGGEVGATSAGESAPGFVGGRGGRGAADEERKRPSYLEGPDPDETFGTDQIVAPPVIGA